LFFVLFFFLNLEDLSWDRNMTSKLAFEPIRLHALSEDFPANFEAAGTLPKGAVLAATHSSA